MRGLNDRIQNIGEEKNRTFESVLCFDATLNRFVERREDEWGWKC